MLSLWNKQFFCQPGKRRILAVHGDHRAYGRKILKPPCPDTHADPLLPDLRSQCKIFQIISGIVFDPADLGDRLYLRDSSLSGAASLPYRLFVENIFPDAWFIQDADAWWNSDQRRNLGQQFLHCLYPDPEKPGEENSFVLEELEKFEHLRWRRYMISRGWSGTVDRNGAMDFEQAVQYIRNGAPGHVLQIAKIHPCIGWIMSTV